MEVSVDIYNTLWIFIMSSKKSAPDSKYKNVVLTVCDQSNQK